MLPKIAGGDLILAFGHVERQSRYDLADVAATARRDGGGYILDGAKSLVLHGDSADKFVVSARLAGGQRDRTGIGLFMIDAKSPGASVRGYATVDGLRAAELSLNSVRSDVAIGEPGAAFPLIEQVADLAMAALAAEAVGAMAAMQDITVDYMKTRKQFGVAIGSFQVLQHRAADMLIALEQARSMAMLATMMAADGDVRERRQAISAAKVQIGRSGSLHRPTGDPNPRRHRHDHGGEHRPLFQARHHDRFPVRRCRSPPWPFGRSRRFDRGVTIIFPEVP